MLASKYFTILRNLEILEDLQYVLGLLQLIRYIYKGGNIKTD
jgi:hypothetical protein